jgi:putative Mg2+ transporter-C (MgtC) family protein
MPDLVSMISLSVLGFPELCLRMFLAMVLAMVIGLDRDNKNKPIDFRAYMIIAASSCAVAIVGQEIYAGHIANEAGPTADLSKIMEGVLTGIGFLGAGAIVKRGDIVVGTATGASIWASGAMGLVLGFGLYSIAFILFLAVMATLVLGGWFMEKVQGVPDEGPNKKDKANGGQ